MAKEPRGWPMERSVQPRAEQAGCWACSGGCQRTLRDRERMITGVTISSPPS